MADTLRESLPKLPKPDVKVAWKERAPKGVVSQGAYERSRGKKASFQKK